MRPQNSSSGAKRPQSLVAVFELLDRNDGRADAADGDDGRIVVEFIEADERHPLSAAQLLQAAKLADVGISAAAGAEDGGADRKSLDVGFGEITHQFAAC